MTTATTTCRAATRRLSTLDRWLPLWIGLAMVGAVLGRFVPALSDLLGRMEVGGISCRSGSDCW